MGTVNISYSISSWTQQHPAAHSASAFYAPYWTVSHIFQQAFVEKSTDSDLHFGLVTWHTVLFLTMECFVVKIFWELTLSCKHYVGPSNAESPPPTPTQQEKTLWHDKTQSCYSAESLRFTCPFVHVNSRVLVTNPKNYVKNARIFWFCLHICYYIT